MRQETGPFWMRYDKVQQAEPTKDVTPKDGSLYALLFNANEGDQSQFSADIRLIYQQLMKVGISELDMLALEGDGKTTNPFVRAAATRGNLEKAASEIRTMATSNDRLLVVVTNHGSRIDDQSTVCTVDGRINETDFAEIMSDLPVNFALFYFSQCYSGGFAERMGYGNNMAISSTSRTKKACGRRALYFPGLRDPIGSYFTRYLVREMLQQHTTIESAFEYAVRKDCSLGRFVKQWDWNPSFERPQLRWQNADPSKLSLC